MHAQPRQRGRIRPLRVRAHLACVITAVHLGCADSPAPLDPVPQPPRDILFSSRRNDSTWLNTALYAMRADGRDVVLVHSDSVSPLDVEWSPDGRRIAYSKSFRQGRVSHIFTMNADGSDLTRLTEGEGIYRGPKWSPSGDRILFTAYHSGERELGVMDADGRNMQFFPQFRGNLAYASWSPDGTRVAAQWSAWIYIISADGSGPPYPEPLVQGRFPDWSPDGGKIAFTGDFYDDQWKQHVDIYVINVDGTGASRLTSSGTTKAEARAFPIWSPDGRRIAYQRSVSYPDGIAFPTGDVRLHVISSDGTSERELTQPMFTYPEPRWSPDGTKIVFSSRFSVLAQQDVFVVEVETGSLTNLTNNSAVEDRAPRWRPR